MFENTVANCLGKNGGYPLSAFRLKLPKGEKARAQAKGIGSESLTIPPATKIGLNPKRFFQLIYGRFRKLARRPRMNHNIILSYKRDKVFN